MFQNVGFPEILLILVVCLLLFGAKRLPEIGSSFGKGIREFKRSLSDAGDALSSSSTSSPSSDHEALPPRRLDAPSTPASGGEPKRLSQ
jgi:sec-independent protein translocase protein TatA